MIKERGLWWEYSEDENYSFLIMKDKNEGFTREQAEEIGHQILNDSDQVLNASEMSLIQGRYQHILVKFDKEESYVFVDSGGAIKKPKLKDKTFKRTLDSSQILGFQTLDDW